MEEQNNFGQSIVDFIDSISGVEDNAISFLGEQLSNIGHSAVTLLDSALAAFGYK